MKTIYNEPSDVWINIREPYNKNSLWIYPGENVEIKIFDKGWKTIFTTEDLGLSLKSKQQMDELVNKLSNILTDKLTREYGKHKSSLIRLRDKERELENRVNELENKLDKMTKRYAATLLVNKR